MNNYKIKVNTPEESKEAQELFFELGYEKGACSLGSYPAIIVTTQDWATGEYCSTRALGLDIPAHDKYKEITLPGLRAMVYPMKEYLIPSNGSYVCAKSVKKGQEDWIEIPEGAEVATICRDYVIFWKDEKYSFSISEENKWCYKSCDDSRYFSLDEYMNEYDDASVIWQRATHPEELPFIDDEPKSLNDQYSEIEQVRQQSIGETLAERQSSYGCYEDVAHVTQEILRALRSSGGYDSMPAPHKESMHMIASKMARLVCGDHNHKDSWHDIGGYAKLIENLIG